MDDIAAAQAQLGKAINRARAGEDRALAGRVRDEGERLVKLFYGALGMAKLHALTNRAFDQPIADLVHVLGVLLDLLGAVHVLAVEDQIYMNDIRIRLEGGDIGADFGAKFREHGIGGLSFHAPLTETQFRTLVATFSGEAGQTARVELQTALRAAGIDSVDLAGIHHFRLAGEAGERQVVDAATVAERGAALLDEAFENLSASRQPNPLPTRRLVTGLLDAGAATQWVLVEAEGISPYAAHNLRVTNLSLLLGHALGLSPGVIQDLGVSAMFHDAGYALCSGATGQALSGERAFDLHPLFAARVLLRQRGFHEAKIRRVMAALDHHRRYDDSRGVPALFGRIVAIAEDFDTLTQPRGGGLSPTRALALMAGAAGTVYDPVLLPLFINVMGAYPRQTRVRLSDGRTGSVVSLARGREAFARPVVRIERLADGSPTSEGAEVDLALAPALRVAAVLDDVVEVPVAPDGEARSVVAEARRAAVPVRAGRPAPARLPSASQAASPDAAARRPEGQPLSEGALPEILGALYLGKESGILRLERKGRQLELAIWEGNVIHAASNAPEDHLGQIAAHAREVILNALGWTEGTFRFEARAPAPELAASPALRLSTPDLILEAVRRVTDPDVLRYHLGNIDRRVRVSAHPRAPAETVALSPLDGYVLSRVEGQMTLRGLLEIVPGQGADTMRSVFGLLCVGLLACVPPQAAPPTGHDH